MGRHCIVETSPHISEYEKMRMDGKAIQDILKYSNETYNETHLKYHHFQRHFQDHMAYIVTEGIKVSQLRDQVIKESIKKTIEIAKRITRDLEIVAEGVDVWADRVDKNPDDDNAHVKLMEYLEESRLIFEQFLKWEAKLDVIDTGEETFTKIMKCIEDFPPDLISKFSDRWEHYDRDYRGKVLGR
jgi:predicted  nucleic acid-binding Zn-ribbon protein